MWSADDTTESVIEKINNKLRIESGAGILSIKPKNGSEITLGGMFVFVEAPLAFFPRFFFFPFSSWSH